MDKGFWGRLAQSAKSATEREQQQSLNRFTEELYEAVYPVVYEHLKSHQPQTTDPADARDLLDKAHTASMVIVEAALKPIDTGVSQLNRPRSSSVI